MNIGLLWFDNDPGCTVAEKVARAASAYRRKHGRPPTHCYVHPGALGSASELEAGGVTVAVGRSILPHHFWIGEEESDDGKSDG